MASSATLKPSWWLLISRRGGSTWRETGHGKSCKTLHHLFCLKNHDYFLRLTSVSSLEWTWSGVMAVRGKRGKRDWGNLILCWKTKERRGVTEEVANKNGLLIVLLTLPDAAFDFWEIFSQCAWRRGWVFGSDHIYKKGLTLCFIFGSSSHTVWCLGWDVNIGL